jgi:quinol monooxygenase YgiN
MLIVHVQIHVKAEYVEAFMQATVANARESRREPGIARFECLQQLDDPSRFVLVEAYRDPGAQAQHRETRHYQIWRDAVAPMMAEPRASVKFAPISPEDQPG